MSAAFPGKSKYVRVGTFKYSSTSLTTLLIFLYADKSYPNALSPGNGEVTTSYKHKSAKDGSDLPLTQPLSGTFLSNAAKNLTIFPGNASNPAFLDSSDPNRHLYIRSYTSALVIRNISSTAF